MIFRYVIPLLKTVLFFAEFKGKLCTINNCLLATQKVPRIKFLLVISNECNSTMQSLVCNPSTFLMNKLSWNYKLKTFFVHQTGIDLKLLLININIFLQISWKWDNLQFYLSIKHLHSYNKWSLYLQTITILNIIYLHVLMYFQSWMIKLLNCWKNFDSKWNVYQTNTYLQCALIFLKKYLLIVLIKFYFFLIRYTEITK